MMNIAPSEFNGFSSFDIVVLVILLVSLIVAANRGLMRELVSLLSLFISAGVALFVFGQYRFAARDLFPTAPYLADGALAVGTFALTYMLMVFLLSGLVKSLKGKKVGFLDRLFGVGFGIFRGLIVASLLVLLLSASFRANQEAQEFKDYIAENPSKFPPEVIQNMPRSMQDQLEAEPVELPQYLQESTFYPILSKIGAAIQALPFTKMKSYADRIKEGDLESIAKEIR